MKRVARVVMVMLLLSTVVAGPAAAATASPRDATVQPEPPDPTPGCGEHVVEKAVQFLSPAYAAYDAATGGDQCNVEEIRQGNQEQEMQDIHAQAQTLAVDQQSSLTAYSNALNDARTVAWTKAECASLDALEANATQAETRVAARDAIERYYSRMMTNVIAERNANWQEFMYLAQTRQNESLNQSVFVVDYMTTDDRLNHGLGEYNLTDTLNYTLPNGSVVQVEAMHGSASGSHIGGGGIGSFSGPLVEGATWPNSDDYGPEDVAWIHVRSTYDNDTVTAYNSTRWWNVIDRIENQNQQMLSNANQTVNGLYGSYVRGNFNISDYRSVQCTADQTGVGVNDTYYSIYAVSALAKAGAETPDLNSTGSMTIATSEFTPNNTTEQFTGLLVASDVPGDSWQTGQTYDPATINGSVTFHVSDSNRSFFLSEPFTLVSAEGRNGQEVSTVNTTQYQYRTENFSELGEKLDRLIELRQEEQVRIEEASSPGDGGTIGWPGLDGGSLGMTGGLVIVGIVAVVLFAARTYLDTITP